MKRLMIGIMVLAISLSGCAQIKTKDSQESPPVLGELSLGKVQGPSVVNIPEKIHQYINQMTPTEKIGQLLMPSFREYAYGENVDIFTQDMEDMLDEYKIGGVILFKENIKEKKQVQDLIGDLQEKTGIPLWIGVDEEGGVVSRISSNPHMGYEPIPAAFDVGAQGEEEAYKLGKRLGTMLKELRFNMDFAPVVDIWSNPNNKVIGPRSFGQDPLKVSQMANQVVKGLQGQQIVSVIKHFPGHGDTQGDTHLERVFVDRSLEELLNRELVPFQKAIDEQVAGVMVAHVELPQIDANVPASLSHKIITDLLKNQLGFEGLIITDALDMEAITSQYGKGEAALKSFMAGADILLMPDIKEAYAYLLKAYTDETISSDRLDESVYKILYTKYQYGIIKEDFFNLEI